MKIIVLILVVFVNMPCFGRGVMPDTIHERYSHDVSEITQYYYRNISQQNNRTHIIDYNTATRLMFNEIKNGLYILTENDYNIICYNVNNNRSDISEIRFMEILKIMDYEINISGKNIEILTSRQKPVYNRGYIGFIKENIRIIFESDENDKIKYYKIINSNDNKPEEEYFYQYNAKDELCNVYSVNNDHYVLCKSIYYDGQLRLLERPFLNGINGINIDEIIIFNGNNMKYHIKRHLDFPHREGAPVSDDFFTKEESYYFVLTEFNNRGDRIKQTYYFHYGTGPEYEFVYLQYDHKNNWIYSQIISGDNITKSINEYKREIKYDE
jgi:hypothetical protein